MSLLNGLLELNPNIRLSTEEALNHEYFSDLLEKSNWNLRAMSSNTNRDTNIFKNTLQLSICQTTIKAPILNKQKKIKEKNSKSEEKSNNKKHKLKVKSFSKKKKKSTKNSKKPKYLKKSNQLRIIKEQDEEINYQKFAYLPQIDNQKYMLQSKYKKYNEFNYKYKYKK